MDYDDKLTIHKYNVKWFSIRRKRKNDERQRQNHKQHETKKNKRQHEDNLVTIPIKNVKKIGIIISSILNTHVGDCTAQDIFTNCSLESDSKNRPPPLSKRSLYWFTKNLIAATSSVLG